MRTLLGGMLLSLVLLPKWKEIQWKKTWPIGTVYVKKTSTLVNGLWLVAIQNMIGGIVLSGIGVSVENVTDIQWNLLFVSILLFGAVLGVTGATAVYNKLMRSGESSKVSSYTFLVPLIAVLLGTIFLNEPFTLSLLVGLVLILLSIYMINRKGTSKVEKTKEFELLERESINL
jgi:drug/metabolite transporter (DMT)-like permease